MPARWYETRQGRSGTLCGPFDGNGLRNAAAKPSALDPTRGSGQGAEDPEADTGGGDGSGGPDSRTNGQAARLRVVTDSPVRDKARFSSWLILCPVCSPPAVL